MPASVVVGIVTRNRAVLLAKAIQSVFEQDMPGLQVAVIDDGSTDATPDLKARFSNIRWSRYEQTRGLIAARNQLMRCASEDYFVSLDDDAWFTDGDEVAVACAFMASHPKAGAIAFDILSAGKTQARKRTHPTAVNTFIGCGHMVRLAAVREAGLYEISPGPYGSEEKDLCIRLMDAGYEIVMLPGFHVWHDQTEVARDRPAQYSSGVANDFALTFRRTPLVLLPFAIIGKIFQHLRFAGRERLLRSCFAGFRLFFRYLPELWRSRRPVRLATLRAYMRLSHPVGPA